MEQLQAKGATYDNMRLTSRPYFPDMTGEGKDNSSRRRGRAVEDLGSSFIKKGVTTTNSQGHMRIKGGFKPAYPTTISPKTSTIDEMDCFSFPEVTDVRRSKFKASQPSSDNLQPSYLRDNSSVYKSLKFTKKNKSFLDDQPPLQQSNASSSVAPVPKEKENGRLLNQPRKIERTAQQDLLGRAASPTRPQCKASPGLSRTRSQVYPQKPDVIEITENARPRPRPINKTRAVSSQLHSEPVVVVDEPSFPKRRNTVSTHSDPRRSISPSRSQKQPSNAALVPASFPIISPVSSPARPTKFPSLAPLDTQDGDSTKSRKPRKVQSASSIPLPPPLSSQGADKMKRAQRKNVIVSESEESELDFEVIKPQPFPMSTQALNSIGYPSMPSIAGPSRHGKRLSSDEKNSGDGREWKKTRRDMCVLSPSHPSPRSSQFANRMLSPLSDEEYEEEDTLTISPSIDPRTLCPYCDAPLPPCPTPLLSRLLASTARKSSREPRPANPLGRKAPFAVFIAVCQRHRFESQILPEAEAKGWPKSIDWEKLAGRIERMKEYLQGLINDPDFESDHENDIVLSARRTKGAKANCTFWKEIVTDVKKKGSRAMAGVRGQFANFEKTQPGYYGEYGSVIIHQTLYDLFPPTSINPNLIAPLTPNEFLQRILVPEVGVRLIMEDKSLEGSAGTEEAVKILRESANYGVAMFPDEGGEDGEGAESRGAGKHGDEIGVGDLIVMERARKRRKELEEENEREEKELKILGETDGAKKRASKKKGIGSQARKGKRDEVEVPPPNTRPRPRPLGKTSSSASVLTNDSCELQSNTDGERTDTDDNEAPRFEMNRSKPVLRRPPTTAGEFVLDTSKAPVRRRPTRSSSKNSVMEICSSNDDSPEKGARTTRHRRAARDNKGSSSKKPTGVITSDNALNAIELYPSSPTTPISERRSPVSRQIDTDTEATPMPSNRFREKTYPLKMAQDRKKQHNSESSTEKTTPSVEWEKNLRGQPLTGPNSPDLDSHSWLLSDNSQNSGSIISL